MQMEADQYCASHAKQMSKPQEAQWGSMRAHDEWQLPAT